MLLSLYDADQFPNEADDRDGRNDKNSLLVSAQRATKVGDTAAALELALVAAQFLRAAREIQRMNQNIIECET